ncbi:MAG: cyclic nucleotide-binding domain-containing protein [Elusimicrobia bacterium]|nr:cyclic nucleotide-binding domain-containing protein [Elusimicrobiota bacterium]
MRKKGLKSILVQHEFLKDMPEPYLSLLEGCASNVRCEAGKYLIREGEEASRFYLVRKGRVNIELPLPRRQPITVQTVGENEVLGWSWMAPPRHWHFDARASDAVQALAFDTECIRAKSDRNHDFGYEIYKRFATVISKRLEETILQIVGLCG